MNLSVVLSGSLTRLVPGGRRPAVVVHAPAGAAGATEYRRFQRTMFGVRLCALAIIAVITLGFPAPIPVFGLAAAVPLMAIVAIQAFWLRTSQLDDPGRELALAGLLADSAAAYLASEAYLATPDWAGYLAYPIAALEGGVFFGMRGALLSSAVSIGVYLLQLTERRAGGHDPTTVTVVTVVLLTALSGIFVGGFAEISRRVRTDLGTLLELTGLLSRQESAPRVVQALDARLRDVVGARLRSVALRRGDGGYDVIRWRSPEQRVIPAEAVRTVSRIARRDVEAGFRDHRAVTLQVGASDSGRVLAEAFGLPPWTRAITLVPMRVEHELSGFLPVLWDEHRVPTASELDLLHGLADHTGLAFAQARLERARELAATDPLTGLANHRSFQDLLAAHLAEAERRGDRLSILFCDLDGFKAVNDRHGHAVGDTVLHRVAEAVRGAARGGDVVARYGGDEMALALPGADRTVASEVALRLRRAVRDIDSGLGIDLTVGIAVYPDDGIRQDDLIARADAAMYAGKRLGGGRVVSAPEVPREA